MEIGLSLSADVQFLSNQEIVIGSLHLNGHQLHLHQISSLQEESDASEAYTPRLILFNPLVMNHSTELIDAGLAELVFLEEVTLEAGKIQSSGGGQFFFF